MKAVHWTFRRSNLLISSIVLIAWGLCGCAREQAPVSGPVEFDPAHVFSSEAVEKMEKADAHDGTVDHMVEDCASCKLHMKGKSAYTAIVNGYAFHLCSDHCLESMTTDPEGVLAGLDTQ